MPTMIPADSGWVYHWDETASAPYLYNIKKKQFYTYDDKRSIAAKTQYVIDNKLGGIMYWHLGQDTYTDGLMDAIYKVKSSYVPGSK
jgi:chitinase